MNWQMLVSFPGDHIAPTFRARQPSVVKNAVDCPTCDNDKCPNTVIWPVPNKNCLRAECLWYKHCEVSHYIRAGWLRIRLCDLFYTLQWLHTGQMCLTRDSDRQQTVKIGMTSVILNAAYKIYWWQTYWVWSDHLKHFSLRLTVQSASWTSFPLHIHRNHVFPAD